MRIEDVYLEPNTPLMRDYIQSFYKIADFYSYDPGDEASFTIREQHLKRREEPFPRSRLVDLLKSYHSGELNHPAVQANLDRLRQPDARVVIGGQQAGWLTGPLYTLYKAITIIQLARREEQRLKKPVVPVFWIAGEDHDVDEVDHIHLPSPDGGPIKHRLSIRAEKKTPVSHIAPEPVTLSAALDELAAILPDTEHKREMMASLRMLSSDQVSLSRHFARLMHRLFGSHGLILVDSAHVPLRRLEVPFFEQLIDHCEEINEAVRRQAERMSLAGYPPQVEVREENANLFVLKGGERLALIRDGKEFITREGKKRWTKEELKEFLRENPASFSNNVITRPLMQEYLFPVLAVVAGPGEIAYWGLLKSAFEIVGLEMPVLFPRASLTLVDRRTHKNMRRFGVSLTDVIQRPEEKRRGWLNRQYRLDVEQRFSEVRTRLNEIYIPLIEEISQIRPDLRQIGETNRRKILHQVGFLEAKTKKALEERYDTDLRRFDQMVQFLCPEGRLQERVYNLIPFWNRFGLGWIRCMVDSPLLSLDNHRVVYL